eukprot:CAMPEP_0172596210 /NCGR_PEP_ID=MMETSP1068-20121228/15968_1 /TAXON_ID=35684 /ORGANISM="Pseudopedinella elastica, Strain CCMP716" /LENGTH=149 /DNA_ID=CAMNT_0013395135 /DNA_START=127 /DNA_END=572 /DNA_ORIENTATION=-
MLKRHAPSQLRERANPAHSPAPRSTKRVFRSPVNSNPSHRGTGGNTPPVTLSPRKIVGFRSAPEVSAEASMEPGSPVCLVALAFRPPRTDHPSPGTISRSQPRPLKSESDGDLVPGSDTRPATAHARAPVPAPVPAPAAMDGAVLQGVG